MITCLIAFACLQDMGPKEALEAIADRYQKLNSLSMTIEHHDSSGLFPGSYRQLLNWRKTAQPGKLGPGGQPTTNRFELIVTDRQSSNAPDYFCNGSGVMARWSDGRKEFRTPFENANTMAGWEVTGGLILGWLQDTPGSKVITDPPEGMKAIYDFGSAREWKGEKVKEIVIGWQMGETKRDIHLFTSPKFDRLVGFEWPFAKGTGWAHYQDQKRNLRQPKSLGDYPK